MSTALFARSAGSPQCAVRGRPTSFANADREDHGPALAKVTLHEWLDGREADAGKYTFDRSRSKQDACRQHFRQLLARQSQLTFRSTAKKGC